MQKTQRKPAPKRNAIVKRKKTSHAIVKRREPETISLPSKLEEALVEGNLANLSPEERLSLYKATCKSLHLNPLTKPFCYILVADWENSTEKLILYAARNCTDQLRALHRITTVPGSLKQWREEGMLKASISVRMWNGRQDSDIGVIPLERYSKKKGGTYKLTGLQLANAEMHVVTKAKRRATLSLCGLGGIVDESELDTMNVIGGTTPDGRIFRYQQAEPEESPAEPVTTGRTAEKTAQAQRAEEKSKAGDAILADLVAKGHPRNEETAMLAEKMQKEQEDAARPTVPQKVEIRKLMGDEFAVTGSLGDDEMTKFLADVNAKSFKANADGRTWHRMENQYRQAFDMLSKKLGLEIAG